MIDKTVIVDTLLQRLAKLPVGHHIDVRTYKRNRSVVFVKKHEDEFLVLQNGYEKERYECVPLGKIKKLFKMLLKKEFPRSTKVRLYTLGEFDEQTYQRDQRKKI